MTLLRTFLALGLLSTAFAATPDSCLWCVSTGSTWNPTLKQCGAGNTITLPLDCFRQLQSPNVVKPVSVAKSTLLEPYYDVKLSLGSDHEIQVTVKSEYEKNLVLGLACQDASKIVVYAAVGKDEKSVELVPYKCGDDLILKDEQFGSINVILNDGAENAILRMKKPSTQAENFLKSQTIFILETNLPKIMF